MTNKTYDTLKWVSLVLLPAAGALYVGVALLWGLPEPEKVVGTISLVDAFLGALLGLKSKGYSPEPDGEMTIVTKDDGSQVLGMNSEAIAEAIQDKDQVVIKVNHK